MPPRSISLFNRIAKDKKINLLAIYYAVSQKNRKWLFNSEENEKVNFSYKILQSISFGIGINDYHNTFFSFDLLKILSKFNPDIVVIPGWSDINSLLALLWTKKNRKKLILRTESTNREKSWRRTLFLPITKFIIANSDLVIGSSKAAADYAKSIVPLANTCFIYSSFDTVNFSKLVKKYRRSKNSIKRKYKIKQKKVVYFNGQLIKRKGLLELLASFKDKKLANIALVITGDGPLKSQVKVAVKNQNNIYYLGYLRQNHLAKVYSIADYFILPSYEETWGLVLIEALASSLPIICSQFVGASELLKEKENGIFIKQVTSKQITKAIIDLINQGDRKYKKIARANHQLAIKKLSYDDIAKEFTNVFKQLA
ncbi:MAG: glycosyltransferase family 4 protein [Candidatus Woesebacteria bacterium]